MKIPSSVKPVDVGAIANEGPKTGFYIRKIVTQFEQVTIGGGQSFGQMLDAFIAGSIKQDEQVASVEFNITDADWFRLVNL